MQNRWSVMCLAAALACAGGCAKKKPADVPAQPTTAFGNELPEPVDDSVVEKSDETPEQPELK